MSQVINQEYSFLDWMVFGQSYFSFFVFRHAYLPDLAATKYLFMRCYKKSVVAMRGDVWWNVLWRVSSYDSSFVMSWYGLLELLWVFNCNFGVAMKCCYHGDLYNRWYGYIKWLLWWESCCYKLWLVTIQHQLLYELIQYFNAMSSQWL